ncbi:MAG TPA: TIM-barrel domain-containing protein [Gemmatimonadaceae bacterium]|nr:TIM-barrel domain-containing protein [Gemmatimonadaceae bacterium]
MTAPLPMHRSARLARRGSAAVGLALAAALGAAPTAHAQNLGDVVDVGADFQKPDQTLFAAARLASFDPRTGLGTLQWDRYVRQPSLNFEKIDRSWVRAPATEFPATEYDRDPVLPFALDLVGPRTVRLRWSTRDVPLERAGDEDTLMLAGPVPRDSSWRVAVTDSAITYTGAYGRVRLVKDPWAIELYDAAGRLLTRTQRLGQPASFTPYVPFSFLRRSRDLGRSTAAVFELAPDEKIFGLGESFTRLNKRGQRVVAYLRDAMGAQSPLEYKAVPFFLSSRGYGMFVHTSAPVTFDVGAEFDAHHTIYGGDELLDVFVFLGPPKEVVSAYTALTGRSPVPPLWSFGFWMSRITYNSEAQVRDVAAKLRQYRIPADVLHLDTGWFETDWRSDYQFSRTRFPDPEGMIRDLRAQGFHVSLWQYTYFTPKNPLWQELVAHGYAVRDEGGRLPAADAVLDFSNPDAVRWYQRKLKSLLDLGVSVIKADFGEGAPLTGLYHSGRTGWYEHNLYPVRYEAAVFQATRQATGGGILWGRSAWAGSQRYPVHWGGDAENTDQAMAAELRAGLSLGLSGFTFWSHDVGGFVTRAPRDLYRRWLAFGVLTSHTRTHGAPPREPWAYDAAFVEDFRRAVDLKYALMPYVWTQARLSAARGWPMLRTLFFEYPDDPTSWLVEDEYLFGPDLLVAPLFQESTRRQVYLPPGTWTDYQTGVTYAGAGWYDIAAGTVPIVLLVKDHTVVPHVAVAQTTAAIDWREVELRVYSSDGAAALGSIALPDGRVHALRVEHGRLVTDPLQGRVHWRITSAPSRPVGAAVPTSGRLRSSP